MSPDPNREPFLETVEKRADIDGRFTDIRRLGPLGGDGAFSLLFSARDETTGRRVALKTYHPDQRHDAYRWASFAREEAVLHQLAGQPDIISWVAPRSEFVETFEAINGIKLSIPFGYYALELAQTNVGAAIASGGWDSERNLVAFRAMCRAVQRIHSFGITHRDLKPSNFLILRGGAVVLSDFGTARNLDGSSSPLLLHYSGFWPGDTRYTPPEMFAGLQDIDPVLCYRADVFALGAVLFELFTGTPLGPQIYDPNFLANLASISVVPEVKRRLVYDSVVSSIASGTILPSVGSLGTAVPSSIKYRIDNMYQSLAALDYRKRLYNFQDIFRQINICLLILRSQARYDYWRTERDRRRWAQGKGSGE